MAAQQLGKARCPLCHGEGARLSLSKNGLAVLTCTQAPCGCQIFARSDDADETMRGYIVAAPEPAPAPAATPAPSPEPTTETPAPAPAPGFRWGILQGT